MRWRLCVVLTAICACGAIVPSAQAGPLIDRAVAALRDDPVYVDPEAERAPSDAEADRLRDRIADSDAAMYVAVLPAAVRSEAGGSTSEVLRAIANGLRRDGTYAVVAGNQFRAGSTTLERGEASRLATEAFEEHGDEGVAATLLGFVDRVAEASGGPAGGPADESAEESDGSNAGLWILLGVGAGGIGLFALRRRRRREAEQAELAEVKREAQNDLLALAEDIRALDLDVQMPDADPRVKEDYAHAVACYERADQALDRARTPDDMEAVSRALEEGRFAMASAKARLEGRPPPEHRPPCFFDPRHGPSVEDVEWAPAGGTPRPVPVCAADAQRIRDGLDPEAREVTVGGERRPYWDAPAAYGPYAGGFFGGAAGIFPGLIIGSLLGSSLGWGAGPAYGAGDDYDDFGGGDFGGGDFGGGDFGGGDFGGGDFGGGE
jgi:MYXO-CTERM domain-containing protein